MSWLRKGLANSGSCFVPARRAGPQFEKLSPFGTLIHVRPPETTIDSLGTSSCLRLFCVTRMQMSERQQSPKPVIERRRRERPLSLAAIAASHYKAGAEALHFYYGVD